MSSLYLNTAGYLISVKAAPGAPLPVAANPFRGCTIDSLSGEPHLTINIVRGVPPMPPGMKRVLHSPFYQQQGKELVKRGDLLWSLYSASGASGASEGAGESGASEGAGERSGFRGLYDDSLQSGGAAAGSDGKAAGSGGEAGDQGGRSGEIDGSGGEVGDQGGGSGEIAGSGSEVGNQGGRSGGDEPFMIKSLVPDLRGTGRGDITAHLMLSLNTDTWHLWLDTKEQEADILPWPLDGLVLYYLAAMRGDILIHASAIEYQGRGYLFTGVSGKGKTTMARIWEERGARVIHDDRVVISTRQKSGQQRPEIFSTPVYDNDEPRSAPLNTICLIDHGSSNSSRPLRGSSAVTGLMANCIQHNWNHRLIESLTGALQQVAGSCDIRKLQFLPDKSVTDHILSHESK